MKHNSEQSKSEDNSLPPAQTGNASNPFPKNEEMQPAQNQLIDERGEKYLREASSIEDYPDAEDDQEMDEEMKSEKK